MEDNKEGVTISLEDEEEDDVEVFQEEDVAIGNNLMGADIEQEGGVHPGSYPVGIMIKAMINIDHI